MSPAAVLLLLSLSSADATNVALLPPTGADAATANALGAQLRRSFESLEGFALQDLDRTLSEVEGARALGLECAPGDDGCYGKLAAALRVDLLVAPTFTDEQLTMVVYDAETGGRLNVVQEPLPPEGPARLTRLRALFQLLLAPEQALGRVIVTTATDASVRLDGDREGRGPIARFEAVREGPHVVVVTLGDDVQEHRVDVVAGEARTLHAPFGEAGESDGSQGGPELSPLLLAGAGVAAVGVIAAVAGGAAATWATVTLEDPDNALNGEDRVGTLRLGQASLGVLVVGGVAAVAGGALVAYSLTSE